MTAQCCICLRIFKCNCLSQSSTIRLEVPDPPKMLVPDYESVLISYWTSGKNISQTRSLSLSIKEFILEVNVLSTDTLGATNFYR